jgi:hypothetical protein
MSGVSVVLSSTGLSFDAVYLVSDLLPVAVNE